MSREKTTTELISAGRDEAARLRPDRIRNYRVKFALGYRCEVCGADEKLIVVRAREGDTDDCFSVRCERHLGRFEYMPGQWPDRVDREVGA